MYIPKHLQCGGVLPFLSLEFKSMDAESEVCGFECRLFHFCQALKPSLYQLLAVAFQAARRGQGPCLCCLVIGESSLFSWAQITLVQVKATKAVKDGRAGEILPLNTCGYCCEFAVT